MIAIINLFFFHNDILSFVFSDPNTRNHARSKKWKDISGGDVRIFLAHLIVMGLVRKTSIESYWNNSTTVKTPFFGDYMSRNTFQSILSNLQVVDSQLDVPRNSPGHDPLFKVRPMLDMMERTFRRSFKPGRNLSFDEGCMPFRGRVRFKCYNPSKPAKFHLKLFVVTDARSGYCLGFDVYVGKDETRCAKEGQLLDPNCNQTTKVVFGLLHRSGLLEKGHHVYMDNYYTSPELFEELLYKYTFACGTVRPNRKGLPKAVTTAKIKIRNQCVFRRNASLLAFRWLEKKPVTMLSTIHSAQMVETGKVTREGQRVVKPSAIVDYCSLMGGVDLNDQLLTYYSFLRKSIKWSRKLLIHCFNMIILNGHIMNKMYGQEKLSHDDYRDNIVKYLIAEGLKSNNIPLPPKMSKKLGRHDYSDHNQKRLTEKHFPSPIPKANRGQKTPSRKCIVCNGLGDTEVPLAAKRSSYWCPDCEKVMCVHPCFEFYHTRGDYKKHACTYRLANIAIPVANSPV